MNRYERAIEKAEQALGDLIDEFGGAMPDAELDELKDARLHLGRLRHYEVNYRHVDALDHALT